MKKLLLTALLICLFTPILLSQKKIDSLLGVWNDKSKHDTVRLIALSKVSLAGYSRTNPDTAFYFAQLGYNYAKEKGLKRQMADMLNNQGISTQYKGDLTKALFYYNQTLTIATEINYPEVTFMAINNSGAVNEALGNFDKAIELYQQCVKLCEKSGNRNYASGVLNSLGAIYVKRGENPKALDYLLQGLKASEEVGDKRLIGSSLNSIGNFYGRQFDYDKALEYLFRALEKKEEARDKRGAAYSLGSIGLVYYFRQENEKALEYMNKALQIRKETKDPDGESNLLNNIALVYKQMGDNASALEYNLKCLKISEALGTKEVNTACRNNIADLYLIKGDYASAHKYGLEALAIAKEINSPDDIRSACHLLMLSFSYFGKQDSAAFYLEMLRASTEETLNTNYFAMSEGEKELYFEVIEVSAKNYYDFTLTNHKQFNELPGNAYNLALTNKGLSLKSSTAMRKAIGGSNDTILIKDYENWLEMKKAIAENYQRGIDTKEIEKEANEMEKLLVKRSSVFSDFDKVKNLNWKQVQAGLKTGEAAIEFVNYECELDKTKNNRYAAFIITKDCKQPEVVSLCTETELNDILGVFQGNNIDFVNKVYGTKAQAQLALYQKVWQPMEKYLTGIKAIYYSPTGLLHKISFAAISKDNNVFLCDAYQLNQQSSTGKVAMPGNFMYTEKDNFMLMGGVKYSTIKTTNEIWAYLPGTEKESEEIFQQLKKKKNAVQFFKAENANEANFKTSAESVNIMHISTHGFFFPDPEKMVVKQDVKTEVKKDEQLAFRGTTNYANLSFVKNKNPLMRSGLALAGANDVWERDAMSEGEDGVLTAQEVSNLDLRNTKLVVLSACETGLGDIKGSEGVYGLQRAFTMAGAGYLIMSLWQVPDKETSEFMQLFYTNLTKVKNISKAFNTTQKAMRKKYDPYYWAAFVLVE